nr:ATP-binding protein [Clostridia bacterium]
MNDKILKRAESKITERRQLANERARQNLLKAYTAPEFKELYNAQREAEIELARRQAYGEPFADIQRTLQQISLKQEFCLKTLGLNSTDLYPNYECKECNDTGYADGHLCNCLKKEINKQLMQYSGFTHKLSTFEDNKYDHPAFDLMQKWCNTKNNKTNILISGYTGTGKTFLTECIANELIKNNRVVLFSSAFNLNNQLLNYHISFDAGREQIIKPFLESEVLIIDDLGTEPMLKNVTCEYLYMIINERMLNNLTTIITTNLDMNDILTNYGERIFSRLANKKISILIRLENEDLRLKSE